MKEKKAFFFGDVEALEKSTTTAKSTPLAEKWERSFCFVVFSHRQPKVIESDDDDDDEEEVEEVDAAEEDDAVPSAPSSDDGGSDFEVKTPTVSEE